MKTLTVLFGIFVGMLTLVGCSSLRPLSSTASPATIKLESPLIITHFLGGETILPAGDYRATMEDKGGYYYAAPAKLIGNGGGGWLLDGGFYLPKGAATPSHYYSVGQHHAITLHRLKQLPQHETKP